MRLLSFLSIFILSVQAVFLDEAYRTDFHYALLGLPVTDRTFFHAPDATSRATLLYTLSSRGVLGAVHPKDGSVVWRQPLSGNFSGEGAVAAVGEIIAAGVGDVVSAWSASEGKLVWKESVEGKIAPRGVVGVGGDVVVAVGGKEAEVRRIDGLSGVVKWTFKDSSKDEAYGVSELGGRLFYVSLQKAMLKGYKIKVTTIDADTGKQVDSHTLSSDSDIYNSDDVLYLGSSGQAPVIAWTDRAKQTLKVNILGTKQEHSLGTKRQSDDAQSASVTSAATVDGKIAFVAHYQGSIGSWADVYKVDVAKGKVTKAYDMPSEPSHSAFAAHAVGSDLFFVRGTASMGSLFTSASQAPIRSWELPAALTTTSGITDQSVRPVAVTSEVVARSDATHAVRSAFLLSNGDWVMTRGLEVDWVRHEGLANTVVARWAEVVEETPLVEELKVEEHIAPVSAFVHRISRHFEGLLEAPKVLQQIPGQITSWLQSFTKRDGTAFTKRDTFGINKLIIAATSDGRAITIDPAQRGKVTSNLRLVDVPQDLPLTEISARVVFDVLQATSRQRKIVFPGLFSSIKSNTAADHAFGIVDGKLKGYRESDQMWHYSPLPGERIVTLASQYPSEPIASIGKVLGDRNVLYKYINPNTIVLITVNNEKHTASVTLLDSISGTVIHSTYLDSIDTSRPMPAVVSENWYAFFYATDPADETLSKGYQVVMSELYESDMPNDRGPLGASSNYSSSEPKLGRLQASKPYVISQVYSVPEEVSHLAVTQTAQGITTRHILATLSRSNSIVSIPRQALDPRRIVGKDPTAAQAEEGISRYGPFINFEPQWIINHKQDLLGIKEVTTAPSLLESTSLVFAYGLDVFGTRVAPSFAFDILGDDFNKVQLMVTVVALLAATFVVAPLIERKQINALWHTI